MSVAKANTNTLTLLVAHKIIGVIRANRGARRVGGASEGVEVGADTVAAEPLRASGRGHARLRLRVSVLVDTREEALCGLGNGAAHLGPRGGDRLAWEE
jgi:hypothetical protein